MGYIKHNTIICTCFKKEHIVEARKKAIEIFDSKREGYGSLVSEIIEYIINTGYSFFIAHDGSKEGWEDSNLCDEARQEFCDWISENRDNFCEVVDLSFGGDNENYNVKYYE